MRFAVWSKQKDDLINRKKKEREELQQNSKLVGDMLMERLQKQLESR